VQGLELKPQMRRGKGKFAISRTKKRAARRELWRGKGSISRKKDYRSNLPIHHGQRKGKWGRNIEPSHKQSEGAGLGKKK